MNATKQTRFSGSGSGQSAHMGSNQSDQPITGQVRPTQYVTVLTKQQYLAIEQKALAGMSVREETSAIQVAFQLGVEKVLRLLREGFVTE